MQSGQDGPKELALFVQFEIKWLTLLEIFNEDIQDLNTLTINVLKKTKWAN